MAVSVPSSLCPRASVAAFLQWPDAASFHVIAKPKKRPHRNVATREQSSCITVPSSPRTEGPHARQNYPHVVYRYSVFSCHHQLRRHRAGANHFSTTYGRRLSFL